VFWYFLAYTAALAAIIVLMVWYSRVMFQKIYGNMRVQIDSIVSGVTPPEWEERLAKALSRCKTEAARKATVTKHHKFVGRRVMDCILFMKRTGLVGSEAEREDILKRLEAFREAGERSSYF
jgi:hypothetical protein